MKRFSILLLTLLSIAPAATALELPCCKPVTDGGISRVRCAPYKGEEFIVCAEAWNGGFHWGDHPGPSSAFGPYGMLSSTRRIYGTAENYMISRYGSWERAARFHRRNNWW